MGEKHQHVTQIIVFFTTYWNKHPHGSNIVSTKHYKANGVLMCCSIKTSHKHKHAYGLLMACLWLAYGFVLLFYVCLCGCGCDYLCFGGDVGCCKLREFDSVTREFVFLFCVRRGKYVAPWVRVYCITKMRGYTHTHTFSTSKALDGR